MKRIILIPLLIINLYSFSQKTNYYYDALFGEQFGVILKAKHIVSEKEFIKLGLEINNTSDNYLILYKNKCKFIVNNNSYYPKSEKTGKIIKPGKKDIFTVKYDGQTDYTVNDFEFKPGSFYTFPSEGKIIETEAFHLPPQKNTINNGSFKINMIKLKKETGETAVKFKCTYTGDKIGIIKPSNCVLKTEEGKEWAPANSKEKIKLLQKNEKASFTLIFNIPGKITDMQFAEMDIVWKNTFSEAELSELNFDIQKISIDKNKTDEKN
jgi:hypothetical protein